MNGQIMFLFFLWWPLWLVADSSFILGRAEKSPKKTDIRCCIDSYREFKTNARIFPADKDAYWETSSDGRMPLPWICSWAVLDPVPSQMLIFCFFFQVAQYINFHFSSNLVSLPDTEMKKKKERSKEQQ